MHKYVPRIHVIAASDYASLHWGLPMTINTTAFNVCSFIAVTAYAVRFFFSKRVWMEVLKGPREMISHLNAFLLSFCKHTERSDDSAQN